MYWYGAVWGNLRLAARAQFVYANLTCQAHDPNYQLHVQQLGVGRLVCAWLICNLSIWTTRKAE